MQLVLIHRWFMLGLPGWEYHWNKKQLAKNFSNICDWFIDHKPSIHFGEDKTKSVLFSSKHNLKLVEELDIRYKEIKIKQHEHELHFDYACTTWYPNLTKKLKEKLQVNQNKCLRFCLRLQCRERTLNELPETELVPIN